MMLDSETQAKSKQLSEELSESDVVAKLGKPDSISLNTCGTNTGAPWQCKQYRYNGYMHPLTVFFHQYPADGTWHVNNWNIP